MRRCVMTKLKEKLDAEARSIAANNPKLKSDLDTLRVIELTILDKINQTQTACKWISK